MPPSSQTILHYAKLSKADYGLIRSPGPGLGNILFPVSRALIGQSKIGGQIVYPTFRQLKFGTFLRHDTDKRMYSDLFRSRNIDDWSLWLKSRTQSKKTEEDIVEAKNFSGTVVYFGLRNYFWDLTGFRQLIADWLCSQARSFPNKEPSYDIAIHVRLGDFKITGDTLPMEWYIKALDTAVRLTGIENPKVRLFTDGDAAEVANDIGLANFDIDASSNALHAILRLADAKVIVGSKSTFSMWGAFLGDARAIWSQDFNVNRYFPIRPGKDIEI